MHVIEFDLRRDERSQPGPGSCLAPPNARLVDDQTRSLFDLQRWNREPARGGGRLVADLPTHHTLSERTLPPRRRLLGDYETCGKEKRLRRAGSAGDTIRATDPRDPLELHAFW